MDVYCFLFTDVMLITKPVKRVEKVKVIRQPLIIRNVVCRDLKDPGAFLIIYLNEFRSAVASYCFQANSATQGCTWVEAINNAQVTASMSQSSCPKDCNTILLSATILNARIWISSRHKWQMPAADIISIQFAVCWTPDQWLYRRGLSLPIHESNHKFKFIRGSVCHCNVRFMDVVGFSCIWLARLNSKMGENAQRLSGFQQWLLTWARKGY